MATSMQTHSAGSFAVHQAERGHDARVIVHRSPPHHVIESPANAYSNVMPIESLMDFSSRHERRVMNHDTPDHRPDWRGSQRSDDSFSAYVEEHRVRESTPTRQEQLQSRHEALRNLPREMSMQEQERHDERNTSWPSTVIDVEESFDQEGIHSQESTVFHASQPLEDEDDDLEGEADLNGEKKRRRRTNKAEANVLASVFVQTQFPDAHTRDALAKRLNMKSKAVSIWFQNRRQAMKKRASRFGGVEGVNGPTVTAATMQVLDVNEVQRSHGEASGLGADRLKRWMSLDDIAATNGVQEDVMLASQPVQAIIAENDTSLVKDNEDLDLSSAPILDLICRRQSQQQLSRMASLPSLASVILAKDESKGMSRKDLRDLLPSNADNRAPTLNRASSHSTLASRLLQDHTPKETNLEPLKPAAEREEVMGQEDGSKCVIMQGKVTFPTILTDEIGKTESGIPNISATIWQRMQSSSSSSDGVYGSPDSNKENRDPHMKGNQDKANADEDEDEERTLRLIASRRAAKEQAKKEKKLSEEGKRYLEEADARVALQQRKRASFSNHQTMESLGKGHSSNVASKSDRQWNRAATEMQVLSKRRLNSMARVPSLDVTAGRDRAKEDDANQGIKVIIEQRMASRLAHIQDKNAQISTHETKATKSMQRNQQRNLSSKSPYRRTPLQAIKNSRSENATMPRSFAPSQSLPASNILSIYATPLTHPSIGHTPSRYDVSRESNARLDGQEILSLPSSQEGSENGSDEWLEAWTKEQRRESQLAPSSNSKILRERSAAMMNSAAASTTFKSPINSKRSAGGILQRTPRHDDSGFCGIDSEPEEDYGATYSGFRRLSKRRLISQYNDSSSPIKKGDERDRLAAETLLGLGSRA